jgi:hypothetical protein
VVGGEIKKAKEGKNYSEVLPLKIDSLKKTNVKSLITRHKTN